MDRRVALSGMALVGLAAAAGAKAAGPHPKIQAALRALADARDELQHAATDFGGHKQDALRAIDAAEEQLRTCLRY